MAQKLQNINTGNVIEVDDNGFKTAGQTMSDVAGYVPVGAGTEVAPTIDNINNGAGDGKSNMDIAGDLLKDIETPMGIDDIRAREQEQIERNKDVAASIFDPLEQSAIKAGANRLGSAKGQVGISRGLGLSTAETSYLASIEKETTDRINEIQKQRAEFISSGNFKAAEIAATSLEKLTEAKNNILFKKVDLALALGAEDRANKSIGFEERRLQISEDAASLAQEQFGFSKESFYASEKRLNRTADIAEQSYLRDVSEEERQNSLDNIARLASSGFDLNAMSDEQITALEARAGLLPGSFESIYGKAMQDAANGEKIDALNIKKLEADINNVYSSIAKRNQPTVDENGMFPGLNKTQSENLSVLISGLGTAKTREEALADLSKNQTLVLLQSGPSGLKIMQEEIDRIFPEQNNSQVDYLASDIVTEQTIGVGDVKKLSPNADFKDFKMLNPKKDFNDYLNFLREGIVDGVGIGLNGVGIGLNGVGIGLNGVGIGLNGVGIK